MSSNAQQIQTGKKTGGGNGANSSAVVNKSYQGGLTKLLKQVYNQELEL